MTEEIDNWHNPEGMGFAPMAVDGVVGFGGRDGMVGGGTCGVRARKLNSQGRRGGMSGRMERLRYVIRIMLSSPLFKSE